MEQAVNPPASLFVVVTVLVMSGVEAPVVGESHTKHTSPSSSSSPARCVGELQYVWRCENDHYAVL
ncbi:hypothetical protein E2C01_012266 [Portunus trituberculatus]|uniref:Secreted protein n=1 Tax=Portunus trituberculatus TaxID=210409 RepID=A0A5B7DDK4_PORTR|nr:hypothetical protein [Portunus trituberculatus]